ncbi:TagK domain-containing protein [Paraburkholderia caribensis]|uniref:TagK domain-containing protein n=1 Tax=Paraburkholderia caribensis TaxID=75105 RepID=UPI001D08D69E|nr:TagK domain-containing protein [Paraburkholderia caribensis]
MDRTEEPTGLQHAACATKDGLLASAPRAHDDQPGDSDPHDTILQLLGSHLDDGGYPSGREQRVTASSTDGNDLLGFLYAHYCRALDTPQSLMSGAWVPSGLPVHADPARDESRQDDWDRDAGGAISGMFGDVECVDQAFGTLRPGGVPDMHERDAVPEILRLFAPPEYKAKARVETVVAPALTQREHHTLAIDSPLTGLNGPGRNTETGNQ